MGQVKYHGVVTAALEAVLLFHSDTPWDLPKRNRWLALTGTTDVTTKVLSDTVRTALYVHRQASD
jgi:hypothetical protein